MKNRHEQSEMIQKLNKLERDITEIRKDISEINSRIKIRDNYLTILKQLHDDFKTLAAKMVLKD